MERQLMNADLIALNKCDLIGEAVIHRAVDELSQICPGREVFPVSALTGEGMGTIIERLI
jgi:G3E family GTPase